MRGHYSPLNTLLGFEKKVGAPPVFSKTAVSSKIVYSPPDMPRMRKNEWEARMNGSVAASAGRGTSDRTQLEGLIDVPVSSSTGAHLPVIQPHLGVVPTQPEHISPSMAPDSYLSDQRASPVGDSVGSLYAWSSASHADMLRLAASSVGPAVSTSPFMEPYYNYGASQPVIHPQFQGVSRYTSQEINKWCMESDPASTFYQSSAPYPAMNSLAFPSPEIPSNVYPLLSEHMNTDAEQWFTPPVFPGPSAIARPTSERFLSPTSAPAASIDSSSVMSTSPAPTLSDFESPSSRHRPASPPSNPADLTRYGIPAGEGVWRCGYPSCTSQALFRRGCDLRKHFNRHRKHLFCRYEGCPQSKQGGFSSKKDRTRHEAKHNPGIVCEWDGCERVFSRVDNMKDHVRRIHRGGGSR